MFIILYHYGKYRMITNASDLTNCTYRTYPMNLIGTNLFYAMYMFKFDFVRLSINYYT